MVQRWVGVLFVLLLAASLRFHHLDAQSFWNDEGNSARLSERSLPLIIEGTASDVHPPLYYLILRGWRELVGDHEFGLRSFSAFAGVLTVAGTMALGKTILKKRGAWSIVLAGGVTAVHPALIYYSQETRMYSLLGLLAVLTTWAFLAVADWQLEAGEWKLKSRDSRLKWLYILLLTAGLYTHYFFPVIFLIHGLIVITHAPRTTRHIIMRALHWLPYPLLSLILYLPWLPIFIRQTGSRPDTGIGFGQFLQQAGNWLAFGETYPLDWGIWVVVGLLGVGVINGRSRIPLIGLITPLMFMFIAGSIEPRFYKFLVTAVPFLILAVTLHNSDRFTIGKVAKVLLITSYGLLITQSLQNLYTNPTYARDDYRGMATRIFDENHPNAGIILDAPNQWEVFTYYHTEGAPVYPLPKSVSLPTAESIDVELQQIASQHSRLYAIFWGETQRDPERLVERWLDEHAFKATDEWVGDVRFVTYAVPDEPATEMETAVNLRFGDDITLKGYTLNSEQFRPGDIVQVTLFWETAVPLQNRYKIFLHLIGPDGLPLAQRDSEPGGGLQLTTDWQPNQTIIDNHGLFIPVTVPQNQYTILLGLYDLTTPATRLPIQTDDNVVDALPLITFVLDE